MRAALSAARDVGDITLMEYLAELRKLREEGAASSAPAAGSSAAPAAGDNAPPNSAARDASDSGSMGDSELVGEDGAPYKRARLAHTPRGSSEEDKEDAPDSAPRQPVSRKSSVGSFDSQVDEMDYDQNGEENEEHGDDLRGRQTLAPSEPPDETLFKKNECVQHQTKGIVQVVRMGNVEDFFNHGRVYCVYKELKPGCATSAFECGAQTTPLILLTHLILLTRKLEC